jgi:hypothetical protein
MKTMSGNKVIKPVSFNITKPDDVKMLEHLKRRNFSGYVKKLIWQDIKRREENKGQIGPVLKPKEELTPAQRLEQAKSKLTGIKNQE